MSRATLLGAETRLDLFGRPSEPGWLTVDPDPLDAPPYLWPRADGWWEVRRGVDRDLPPLVYATAATEQEAERTMRRMMGLVPRDLGLLSLE
jgi:hypothetical protein